MSFSQDPTPCPLPRFSTRQASSKLAPLIEESAASPPRHHQPLLRGAKPRRPTRKARGSGAWDPTIDIYDDTFAFKSTEAASAQVASAPNSDQILTQRSCAQSLNRRTSLWAQPAQRLPLDADVKRRRVSSIAEPQSCSKPQPSTIHTNADASAPANQSYLRKDPRRRTIWVPSDDTTVMTIHPGASLQNSNHGTQRPRRSDLFLDVAESIKEDDDRPNQSLHTSKAPRKSLLVAPRKAPLQVLCPTRQPNSPIKDVVGSGGGKENVPPGTIPKQEENKPKEDDTCLLKVSARRLSIAAPKGNPPSSSGHRISQKQSRPGPLLSKDVNSPSRTKPSTSLQGNSPLVNADQEAQHIHSRRSTILKRYSLGQAVHAKAVEPAKPPSQLFVPVVSQPSRRATSIYPALTSNVPNSELYEENWLSHQEYVITELMNDLFERAGRSDDIFAQGTIELQKQLVDIYHDPALLLLHKRLKASLQFGALGISKDALVQVGRFKDDLQQRQRFLDLWVRTYNLQSLQSVAEVVIGREVSLNLRLSNSSPRGQTFGPPASRNRSLEAFLKTFLIRNEDAVAKTSSNSVTATEDGCDADFGSTSWLWRRTVVRSLMIILLLDKAQKIGVFTECLFQPASPFKSSTAVIQAFGNLLLPSVGNINRVLEHLSYHVEHVQCLLEEQTYHVNNLAIDLRDGILLTRLVEILLYPPMTLEVARENITLTLPCGYELVSAPNEQDPKRHWPLSQHLKHLCHSRVQRLYNVQIALSALGEVKEFEAILRDITPEDIVDGHREKNVSLLWSIVGKWGLSALLDFDLVEREIRRLDKRWEEMKAPRSNSLSISEGSRTTMIDIGPCASSHKHMLTDWGQKAARLHGVTITNASTSYFGGQAYRAIAAEYLNHVVDRLQVNQSRQLQNPANSASSNNVSLIEILTQLGCSRAFISLFRNTSTVPSEHTTIPLLAFLASRFLPASQPYFAATTIQRAWRRHRTIWNMTRRVKLAVLARDCATVVAHQQKITCAAVVLQRWWRRVATLS